MRIQIFSDLHADVMPTRPITIAAGADIVVVAGDVCAGIENGFARLRAIIPAPAPIVMVTGNHEYYGRCLPDELVAGRAAADRYGIRLLENETVTIGGVRLVGCSLWTDYALFGEAVRPLAMAAARERMNDHRRISWAKQPWCRFRPEEALGLHRQSRAFLEQTLATPFAGATIVVTHHAPHPGSVADIHRGELTSAAYASDLTGVIDAGKPALWVHGHTHRSFDYRVGATRIICNPHGYGGENPAFDPGLTVDVDGDQRGAS